MNAKVDHFDPIVFERQGVALTRSQVETFGREIDALTYVVDRSHRQYAGLLPRDRLLEVVRDAHGQSGPNPEYIHATVAHLEEIGMRDAMLHWLSEALKGPA